MSIKLRKKPAALVPSPDGMYVQLFVDEDGLPKIKDSTGALTQLSGGQTTILASSVTVPSNSLSDITEFTFGNLAGLAYYAFEFHLTIDQSVAPGILGLTVQADSLSFILNATMIRSNTAVTYSSTSSSGSVLLDDSARASGTVYECVLTGGFRAASSPEPLVVRASRSAGTTEIATGSWGRVWNGTGV